MRLSQDVKRLVCEYEQLVEEEVQEQEELDGARTSQRGKWWLLWVVESFAKVVQLGRFKLASLVRCVRFGAPSRGFQQLARAWATSSVVTVCSDQASGHL